MPSRVCTHLAAEPRKPTSFLRLFTGEGVKYDLICEACGRGQVVLSDVTPDLASEIEEAGYWVGTRGEPEVRFVDRRLGFSHESLKLADVASTDVRAVAPLTHTWLMLTAVGDLLKVNVPKRSTRRGPSLAGELSLDGPLTMVASADDAFVAIAESRGRRCVVLEVATGRVLVRLVRGDYHCDVSPFGLAFVVHEGRTVLVHATDWNRLDVTEPRNGSLLTARALPEPGERSRLDYFHGALHASPSGRWIADDGWVWHPVGVVTVFSVPRWLSENPWESEDGPSRRVLAARDYCWDTPMCWIDDATLAVWGYGSDDEWLVPAVRRFDVSTGVELAWFPCEPTAVEPPRDVWNPPAFPRRWMVHDGVLFVVTHGQGISAWDPSLGAGVARDNTVSPVAYQRATRTFISLASDGGFVVSRLAAPLPTGTEPPREARD